MIRDNSTAPAGAAPEAPGTAPAASAEGRSRRRQALIVAAGGLALVGGFSLYRSLVPVQRGGLDLHAAPRSATALRFTNASGTPTSLADFRGRVVLLNVWATWCPPCREEMPTLDRLQAALGGPAFEVVTVSIDSQGLPVVEAFFRQIGIRNLHPYLDAFHEAGALGAAGIPLTLLIDRQGREVARKLGPATWDDPAVMQTIRRYLPEPRP